MLREPKTENFLLSKIDRDEYNISSKESLANIHWKSDGEGSHSGGKFPHPRSPRPELPAGTCGNVRRRLVSESVPHTCRAASVCRLDWRSLRALRASRGRPHQPVDEPGPCRVRVSARPRARARRLQREGKLPAVTVHEPPPG